VILARLYWKKGRFCFSGALQDGPQADGSREEGVSRPAGDEKSWRKEMGTLPASILPP